MIAGFIISGDAPKKIVARGIGPSLTGSGVSGVLADPVLDLRDANGATILLNDNWREGQRSEIEGTVYEPKNNLESAIVATLQRALTPQSSPAKAIPQVSDSWRSTTRAWLPLRSWQTPARAASSKRATAS
jgi:hypothetical protein